MSPENVEIKHHYHQKWVRILNTGAVTFGRHIFFRRPARLVTSRLIRHEHAHVMQYNRHRLWGQWWLAIPIFLAVYAWQWVCAGFRYKQIRYELEAWEIADKKK